MWWNMWESMYAWGYLLWPMLFFEKGSGCLVGIGICSIRLTWESMCTHTVSRTMHQIVAIRYIGHAYSTKWSRNFDFSKLTWRLATSPHTFFFWVMSSAVYLYAQRFTRWEISKMESNPNVRNINRRALCKKHPYHPHGRHHIRIAAMRLGRIHMTDDSADPSMPNYAHSKLSKGPNISPKKEKVSTETKTA